MRSASRERIPLYHVDAFSKKPFAGNPAAVCLLEEPIEDCILQSIAAEMNLSETAFLLVHDQSSIARKRLFSLRWFTPRTEVDLCGHATLATAAVLFHEIHSQAACLKFETRSGILIAKRENDQGIMLDLPSYVTTRVDPDHELLKAAGITDFESVYSSRKSKDLLVLMKDEESVRNLKPNFDQLKSLKKVKIEGLIVTAKGHEPYDFVSRCFAPWVGINEDPVTGAAHAVLAPFWSKILKKKEMKAFQASERGGELGVKILMPHRVGLIGNAVILSKGQLVWRV